MKVLAHTHPGGDLRLSEEDKAALGARNQTSSVVVGASGKAVRLGSAVEEAHGAQQETAIEDPMLRAMLGGAPDVEIPYFKGRCRGRTCSRSTST